MTSDDPLETIVALSFMYSLLRLILADQLIVATKYGFIFIACLILVMAEVWDK